MSSELQEPTETGYKLEVAKTKFDTEYTLRHIKLPKNPKQIPQIIGWAGPARSGTTSLLFLLAAHPKVDRVHFQPLKTILRQGGPDFNIASGDLICLKEVFRRCCALNDHDPISMLLRAGVPAENITWIAMLRDPVQNYASWMQRFVGCTPEDYAAAQAYTIDIYNKYRALNINIAPFAYDLLALGEAKVLGALLKKVGLEPLENLEFNSQAIERKMSYGQAVDPEYFDVNIRPTLERKRYVYTKRVATPPADVVDRIQALCQAKYDDFYSESLQHLGL